MLAIARALMARRGCSLLDEPSLGLAPLIVEQVADVIARDQRRRVTVVLVEQNAAMALGVAYRAVVLEVGRGRAPGGPGQELARATTSGSYLGSRRAEPGRLTLDATGAEARAVRLERD